MTQAHFTSFWQAGFEGADHVNGSGLALCMNEATGHLTHIDADYERLAAFGIRTVRESAGWRSCETGGQFNFDAVGKRMQAAQRHGIQIAWTFWHYGIPDDVHLFADDLPERFARFCDALGRYLQRFDAPSGLICTPVNEISFLAWAVCETGLIHPHRGERKQDGYALKKHLVRAAIAGCRALRSMDADTKFLHVDPLIHIVAPVGREGLASAARDCAGHQFQAWDMLCGMIEPELGGEPGLLDTVGVNYYHGNQWEHETDQRLHWHLRDPRRRRLSDMLIEVSRRYGRPVSIAETSHVGEGRGRWIEEVAAEVAIGRAAGCRIEGICLYPAIDRPDWEAPGNWHRSGLWDVNEASPQLPRRECKPYAASLRRAQSLLARPPEHPPQGRTVPNQNKNGENRMHTLIVFSHLRWNFVYQRPQHLLQRLAQRYRVVFVEEPVFFDGPAALEVTIPADNVLVWRPHTPMAAPGFHDDQFDALRGLLAKEMEREAVTDYSVWLYTPMALPLLNGLHPRTVIYDCMDELSAFRNAPPQLASREATLFQLANLVLTGGPSLYEAKRHRHPNVHCLPSSVDEGHFAQARDPSTAHASLSALPQPRLGFFGVIDERIDTELLRGLAAARPDWQVCMVGPVVKIDPATLPRAPNIHYFPQQDYADLPAFLAGWDVCLLPFARNEATRFISPTKTLEYMAAEKPVVSTSIADVIGLYGEGVAIADSVEETIAACEAALGETAVQRAQRVARQRQLTTATSWDTGAERIAQWIEQERARGLNPEARAFFGSARVVQMPRPPARSGGSKPCVILGAGPTGLSAAYHFGRGSVLVERNAMVGGWCRSITDRGFQFDYAGHIMFSNDAYVLELYRKLLGDNLHWQDREAWIYSKNVYTRYPFQGALYGLPPDVLKECLVGAIEARFGSLNGSAAPTSNATNPQPQDCCADGVACDSGDAKDSGGFGHLAAAAPAEPRNFEEFIYKVWGAGVAKHFAIPYNRKLWGLPLSEMETSWLGGRVPLPNLEEMIDGALQPVAKPVGPNARFGYPLRGGFQALVDGFLPHLRGELLLDTEVVRVSPRANTVTFADGRELGYSTLISTIPLPALIRAIGDEAPAAIHAAARALRHVSVRCVNLGIGRENLTEKHWIYYPEDTVFHRIFVQGNASPHCSPPGGFGLTCEITYSPTKPLPVEGNALIERCIMDCVQVGIIRPDDAIIAANQVDMPYAYVVYDHARARNVALIREWLAERGILLAGRYSEWEYYNSDHAFLAGRKVAEAALARSAPARRHADALVAPAT